MTEPDPLERELQAARTAHPVGDHVTGTVTEFEIVQHRRRQVRLWPLDAAFRSDTARLPMTEPEWHVVKNRHPVGSEVTAEVIHVFPSNREYVVTVDGVWCGHRWGVSASGPCPRLRGRPPA